MQALRATYGYEPVVFTNAVPGTALTNAIVFCRIKSFLTGSRLVSVTFADHCDPLVSSSSDLNNLLSHAEQTLASEACQYFELRCLSSTPTHFEQRATGQSFAHRVLDLRTNIEILFRHFQRRGFAERAHSK